MRFYVSILMNTLHPKRLQVPSMTRMTLKLSCLMMLNAMVITSVGAEEGPNPQKDSSKKDEGSNDSLWAIQPNDTLGSAGFVDFDQNGGPPRFNWDRLDRDRASDKVFIEHHGYFRFRADLLNNFDLNTYDVANRRGTSQYLPPLTDREGSNQKDSDSLSTANLRFRYEPTLHATERFRVHAVLDIPDNLVLGSMPDGGPLSINQRPDALIDGLSGTQTPIDGAVRLRNVWGVWENDLARFDFGRMRHHWGLGLLANGGACLDCDFGDSVDRVQMTTQLFDIYLSISWDFVAEGPSGFGVIEQVMGQRWDWDQRDDVDQYSFSLGQRAISSEELAKQREDLRSGKGIFEWGFYGILRTQQNAGAYLDAAMAAKRKVMGFGHREYKVKDPRAVILQGLAEEMFDRFGHDRLYDVARAIEEEAALRLGPKGIYPNVDFYSGLVYRKLGIPRDLFTPVFAIARVAGWLAHWREQLGANRIFRPSQIYSGSEPRSWSPIDERASAPGA